MLRGVSSNRSEPETWSVTFYRDVLDRLFGFDDRLREMFLADFDEACTDPMVLMSRVVLPKGSRCEVRQFESSFSERGFSVVARCEIVGHHIDVRDIVLVDHHY